MDTPPLLQGHLSPAHTSNLTAVYLPQNTPTPYSILILSVLISLLISCYGVPSGLTSLGKLQESFTGPGGARPKGVFRRLPRYLQGKSNGFVEPQSELEQLHREDTSYAPRPPRYEQSGRDDWELGDVDPDAEDGIQHVHPELRPRQQRSSPVVMEDWMETSTPLRKALSIGIITYQTYRSVISFLIALFCLLQHSNTAHSIPAPSPSNLLLLMVSVQIWCCNLSFPRLIRLILTIDIALLLFAFLSISYSPLSNSPSHPSLIYPSYSELNVTGGTCPVFASNCRSQMHHWDEVGCGGWTILQDYDGDNDDDGNIAPGTKFYNPYAKSGDINTSANPLYIIETVIYVVGTIQAVSALYQVYSIRYLIVPKAFANSRRGQCGYVLLGITILLGIMGAFVASLMSIAGHVAQETGTPKHVAWYLDSVGPVTNVNSTLAGYEGQNGTSWSDCFEMVAPTGTHWGTWSQHSGIWTGLRVAAGI